MAKLYWALAVLGGALALGTFFGLIGNYPATQSPLQGFFANRAAATATIDVLWAIGVFLIWAGVDSRRAGRGYPWLILPITLIVGLCAGLPAYLAMRESRESASAS